MIKDKKVWIVGSMALFSCTAPLCAEEKSLGEDPFLIELSASKEAMGDRPWDDRSPEALRAWAKENFHHKLGAKRVINEEEHSEWAWYRKSGLGLFLCLGLPSANPDTGDAWAVMWNEAKEVN